MQIDSQAIEQCHFFSFGSDHLFHERQAWLVTVSSSKQSLKMSSNSSIISNLINKFLAFYYYNDEK